MSWVGFTWFTLMGIFWMCDMQPINDAKLQCRKYDFNLNFNISAEKQTVVVYNSALCKRCQQKLFLFKGLQHRFQIAGFNNLRFIMLTTELSGSAQFDDLRNKTGNVTLISLQDINNDFFVPGSIYVFDKCSRLTYELVPPFSEIQNQIVKAAVLSTWYDSICGNCELDVEEGRYFEENYDFEEDQQTSTTELNEFRFENTEIVDPNESYIDDDDIVVKEDDSNFIVPLKVIIPVEHIHKNESSNSYVKYNYLIFNSNESFLHDHLPNDNTEILFEFSSEENMSPANETSFSESNVTKYFTNIDGANFTIKRTYQYSSTGNASNLLVEEVQPVSNAVAIIPSTKKVAENSSKLFDTSTLLRALHPWLSFRLVNRHNAQQP